MGASQVGVEQTSLAPGKSQVAKLVRSLDLRTIVLLEGSLSAESVDDKVIVSTLNNIGLNIATLPNEYLHVLQRGVTVELRAWEQRALNLISEYRVNNEKMFAKKTKALKAKETIQAQSAQLAAMATEAWRTVSKLHIPKEAPLEAKIRKLVVSIRDAKVEVVRVQFELNMKITELELKS